MGVVGFWILKGVSEKVKIEKCFQWEQHLKSVVCSKSTKLRSVSEKQKKLRSIFNK